MGSCTTGEYLCYPFSTCARARADDAGRGRLAEALILKAEALPRAPLMLHKMLGLDHIKRMHIVSPLSHLKSPPFGLSHAL